MTGTGAAPLEGGGPGAIVTSAMTSGASVQVERRARAQLATACAAASTFARSSTDLSCGGTDKNYNRTSHRTMSDQEFGHTAGDPLPDRLKQYLGDVARRELDTLRTDLEVKLAALETALLRPDQHGSIETLVFDLARAATVEAEAAASRAMLDAQIQARERSGAADAVRELEAERQNVKALQDELEDVRRHADAEIGRGRAERKELTDRLDALRRELNDAQQALHDAQRGLNETQRDVKDARKAADARATDLAKAREAAGAAQAEAAARMRTLEDKLAAAEAAKADAERVRREAVSRADAAEVFARETAARARNAEAWGKDLDTRMKEAEARAAREEARLRDAEARADAAVQARDALAKERETLAAERAAFSKEREASAERAAQLEAALREYEQRLAAADERTRALELQLFQRDRAGQDRDEDLSGLLASAPPVPIRPTRAATRYHMAAEVKVDVDGALGLLVDLSTSGAQMLSPVPIEEGKDVQLRLLSDEMPATCRGRVVWTRLEAKSSAQPFRYRAGVLFTQVDLSAVEAFIIRYATT